MTTSLTFPVTCWGGSWMELTWDTDLCLLLLVLRCLISPSQLLIGILSSTSQDGFRESLYKQCLREHFVNYKPLQKLALYTNVCRLCFCFGPMKIINLCLTYLRKLCWASHGMCFDKMENVIQIIYYWRIPTGGLELANINQTHGVIPVKGGHINGISSGQTCWIKIYGAPT